MRFLIDENVPFILARLLESSEHDVFYAGHSDLRSSQDDRLELICRAESRVLVTKDVSFAEQAASRGIAAILIRVPDWFGRREIREAFESYLKHPLFVDAERLFTIIEPGRVTGTRLSRRQP